MVDEDSTPDSRRALRMLAAMLLLAGVAAVGFAGCPSRGPGFASAASVSLLLLGTSALCGGLLGFLFGIPLSLQNGGTRAVSQQAVPPASREGVQPSTPAAATGTPSNGEAGGYIANTNLEQISDWLTKILVGVGLTQVAEIRSTYTEIVASIAPSFLCGGYERPFVGALLLFGVVIGFLFGYLWTRLFLLDAFRYADQIGTLTAKAEAAEKERDRFKEDAEALSLVERQLNPRPDTPAPTETELSKAVSHASPPIRAQIFYRASNLRSRTWRDPSSKPTMELVIPVFRALIASDTEHIYYENHGELGYALKDKVNPDYATAEREFTSAIHMRDRSGRPRYDFYEFSRAFCIIQQDPQFLARPEPLPSETGTRQRVLADLRVALQDDKAVGIVENDPIIMRWCTCNKVSLASLRGA